jgi:hypothetical protein
MKGHGRWLVLIVVLAFLVGVASDQAKSQSAASSPAAPFPIRQTAYLKASNAHAEDHFACGGHLPGHSGNAMAVSADGNTLAVGAPHESSNAKGVNGDQNNDETFASGAVYIFVRQGNSWTQQAYIKASNPQQSANFGLNVALNANGNTLAVSAYMESSASKGVNSNQDDESLPQAGAVYVFTRTGTTWSQQAYIKASNTGRRADPNNPEDWGDGDQFGFSVALSGDGNLMAVGALSEDSRASGMNNIAFQDDDSAADAGAVYMFSRTGNNWSQTAYLKSMNNDGGDRFGFSVGLSNDGNTMVVGGYDEDGSGRTVNPMPDNRRGGSGAVYILVREGGNWRQQAYLKGSQANNNDALGVSVAISADGNTVAAGTADDTCLIPGVNPVGCIGATWPPHLGAGTAGGVYVWGRTGTNWAQQAYLKATNPDLEDLFGVRVTLSGDGNTLVVSAPAEDGGGQGLNGKQHDNSAVDAGAAYIFTRAGTNWAQRLYLKGSNTEQFDEFGSSSAISGDGKTIFLGAMSEASAAREINGNQNDNTQLGAGAVYVFAVE